uniref:Tyr recombinase domain-containing protein n=1 Tax=Magallana gigas TaxID=29159 RepID=A0A8W8N3W6_MAGGI
MGNNTTGNIVKVMCEAGGIQGRKVNHSARKTAISSLVHAGVPPTIIQQLSGHKNVNSINNYSTASNEQQRHMSSILTNYSSSCSEPPVTEFNSSSSSFDKCSSALPSTSVVPSSNTDDIIHQTLSEISLNSLISLMKFLKRGMSRKSQMLKMNDGEASCEKKKMDPGKRDAILDLFFEDKTVTSITDVSSGREFLDFIARHDCSKNFNGIESRESIFTFIRQTLEEIYGSTPEIDFQTVIKLHQNPPHEKLEFELSKILLALIGAFFQHSSGDVGEFGKVALNLPDDKQQEILQMLKHIIREDVQLNEEFFAVLSKHLDSDPDGVLFLKLVTPTPGPEAWAPLLEQSFNFASRCINGSMRDSPTPANHQNNSVVNLSVLGINSALRKMSLNSSPAPASLANLMHSPQLMQKAQLRQREREIKRLELDLKNEQYMRCDLELDLKEKCSTLEQKELKIRELKESIKEQRKLRDAVDELDDHVQKLNEKLNQFLQSSKAKMTEFQEMKQQKEYFEKQYEETLSQYNQMEEAMCSLISFKERYHEYRSKCHTQEEEMLALQSRLQHRAEEIEALKGELSSMNEARQCALQQFNDMKREKGELKDMFAANNMGGCVGESMGVVTDIRIRDLEAELTHLKSAWIDPITHDQVKKELLRMTKAMEEFDREKQIYENRRRTMTASYDTVLSERTALEQTLSKEKASLMNQIEDLQSRLSVETEQTNNIEESLKIKLVASENSLQQSETVLNNETKDNVIKALKEEMMQLKEEIAQTEEKLNAQIMTVSTEAKQQEESAQKELAQRDQNIEELKQQLQSIKAESKMQVDQQTEEKNNLVHEVDQLKSENERLKTNCEEMKSQYQMSAHDNQMSAEQMSELKKKLEEQGQELETINTELLKEKEKNLQLRNKDIGGSVGESKGVVTDIRIRDLEAELTHLKSAWIDPITHDQVKKELLRMTKAMEEFDREKQIYENRRRTMTASYDTVLSERTALEQTLSKEKASLMNQIEDLQSRLSVETEQTNNIEESLKIKLVASENSLQQSETVLNNETKDNVIKALKEEMMQLKEEIAQTEEKLNAQIMTVSTEAKQQEESAQKELAQRDQNIEELKQQLQSIKAESKMQVDQQTEEKNNLVHEVDQLKSENERLKTNCEEMKSQYQMSAHDNQMSAEQMSELKKKLEEQGQELETINTELLKERRKICN